MLFTVDWLSHVFHNQQNSIINSDMIEHVTTDSRKKVENALFIPLKGETFDGHEYVQQALDNGAIAILWDKKMPLPDRVSDHTSVFFVDDTLIALQELASHYRQEINPTVIAITGSNGKTTTKDLVAAIMRTTYRTHYTNGNFNNHIGVPLTILSMAPDTEVLVLEMGMNHAGEISRLSKLARPNYAIITNIGESHIEHLGSREGIAKAKLEIVDGLSSNAPLLIDGDEPLLADWHGRDHVVSCGFSQTNDVVIKDVAVDQQATTFSLAGDSTYHVALLGKHHAKNASFAVTLGTYFNISAGIMNQALQSLTLTSMRFELLTGINGVSVINDAYNASPTSMIAAIDVVKQMTGFKQKVLVLGDMLELGEWTHALHASVAEVIDDSLTAVFTLGDHASAITEQLKRQGTSQTTNHFTDRNALLEALHPYVNADTLILFKASRMMKFELFAEALTSPK